MLYAHIYICTRIHIVTEIYNFNKIPKGPRNMCQVDTPLGLASFISTLATVGCMYICMYVFA